MKKLEDVKKIAIVGGGAMGHGCAMVFAGAGIRQGPVKFFPSNQLSQARVWLG